MAEQEKKEKAMRMSYKNRKTTILKKGEELSTLCNVKACVILVSPDGKLETWPENLNDVKAVLSALKGSKIKESGGRGGGLRSRIKISKPVVADNVKGVEIAEKGRPETSHQENRGGEDEEDVFMIDNMESLYHGATPLFDLSLKDQWGANKNTTFENFGKCIQEPNLANSCGAVNPNFSNYLVPNQECSLTCQHYEIGSSSSVNQEINFSNSMMPNQTPNLLYHQYEIGGRRAVNSEIDFSNHMMPNQTPNLLYYHQYEIGGSSAVNPEINFSDYMMPNQTPNLAYHQYEIGSSSAMKSEVLIPNQHPHPCYAYGQQYQWSSTHFNCD